MENVAGTFLYLVARQDLLLLENREDGIEH